MRGVTYIYACALLMCYLAWQRTDALACMRRYYNDSKCAVECRSSGDDRTQTDSDSSASLARSLIAYSGYVITIAVIYRPAIQVVGLCGK